MIIKEPILRTHQENPKKESVLRDPKNIMALYLRLQNVYAKRPDPLDKKNSFVGAMNDGKFASEYSKEAIALDALEVETIRENIDQENSSMGQDSLDHFEENFAFAEAAQAMITDLLNKWLPEYQTIMTADFDDLKVGVDMVMKHIGGGYLGVALDATVTGNPDNIKNKLQKNWESNIIRGKLPVVKYFQDPDTGYKGRLIVPKFIIGISADDVNLMAKAYLSGKEDELDSHPFRKLILEQIEEQLNDVILFYEKKLKDDEATYNTSYRFAHSKYLEVEKMIKESKKQLVDSNIIDRLGYHEYAMAKNAPLQLMKEFISKKNEAIK